MSNINQQGEELWSRAEKNMPGHIVKHINDGISYLTSDDFKLSPIGPGTYAPEFSLQSFDGTVVTGSEEYAKGTVILFFYRGQWCPFCNLQLRAYADQLNEFEAKGARLIAVSPELPDFTKKAVEENGVTYPILFDENNELGKRFGIAAEVPADHIEALKALDLPLTERNGVTQWELPAPAVFIIKQEKISSALIETNYRQRAEVEDILELI